MKRNLIIAFIILLVSTLGYFWYSAEDSPFSKDLSVFKAVPVSSPFFIELNGVQKFGDENPIWQEMEQAGMGKQWFNLRRKADSLMTANENIPKNLRNTPVIISFGFAGRNELFPVVIGKAGTQNRRNAFTSLLHALHSPQKCSYRQRQYGKHIIHEIISDNPENALFYSFSGELFLISPKSILLEQVLRQLSSPGILKNPFFTEVTRQAGDQHIALYINHAWLSGFMEQIFSRNVTKKTDEFGNTISCQPAATAKKFKNFAGWSKLNSEFYNDRFELTGISAADDSVNHFLAVFSGQQPVRSQMDEVLPRNTSFFCSYSFSDKGDFFKRLEHFYTHSENFYQRERQLKRIDREFRVNARDLFQKWAKDEITVAATTIPVNPENKTTFFIMPLSNAPQVEKELQNLLKNFAERTERDFNQMVSESGIDGENFRVYQFPFPSFPGQWLGVPFNLAEANFFTFRENLLVCSNSEEGLNEYLRNMTLGATLNKSSNYQHFMRNFPNKANLHVFVDINKAFGSHHNLFSSSLQKQIEDREETIRKFGMMHWQAGQDKDIFSQTMAVAYQPDRGNAGQTAWQSAFGSNLANKPQLVTNHYNPDTDEIIFQDAGNNLHLINSSGQELWSVSLPGHLMGEIYQIDYFKNGKLQYLFNTRRKLFLLDRNGNNVDQYPVELKSPATNGVNVFDYDHTRNYRFFVAGEDRQIYAYDASGNIVRGWKFGQTDHPVTTSVQHFRIAGKDYIVFKDKSKIYILNRRGETRVSTAARFENTRNPLEMDLTGTPKIVTTNKEGKVYYIYFNGKFEKKESLRVSENHFFTAEDLEGNGVLDFIFVDGDELTVLDEKGNKLFEEKFDNPILSPPAVYTFSPDLKKVGIVDAAANRIYLYNPDGTLHPGFPLPGNSDFTIGRLSENSPNLNLLVGNEGGRLLNYIFQE